MHPDLARSEPRGALVDHLLNWYATHKRDLPWRRTGDPYAIWVSEIMAQQTRISTLIPYYDRFMTALPTVESLARADVGQVLRLWAGLGYYRRAHQLHQAAQEVMDNHAGQLPADAGELRRLPGIGDYTAAAIASIAFSQPVVPIDGNVMRIFARLRACDLPVSQAAFKRAARTYLSELVPRERPGDFAQSLMDLGSQVCVPRQPRCGLCPLVLHCLAHTRGMERELPVRPVSKPQRHRYLTVLLVTNARGDVLVRQRQEQLLQGMWEFYHLDGTHDPMSVAQQLGNQGYTVTAVSPLGSSQHAFSHLVWCMQGYACVVQEEHQPEGYRFLAPSLLAELALPAALRFYARELLPTRTP